MIASRLALAVVTLLAVSAIIFVTTEVLPGTSQPECWGVEATATAKAAFRARLHLDRPVYERYWIWLEGALHADFGKALTNDRLVIDVVAPRLRNTLIVGAFAFILYIPAVTDWRGIHRRLYSGVAQSMLWFQSSLWSGFPCQSLSPERSCCFYSAVALPVFPVMSINHDGAGTPLETLRALALPATTP